MKKKLSIILAAILTISAFSFVAGAYAFPFMNWRNMPPTNNRISLQQNFVRMYGNITTWENTNVMGELQAQSRTIIVNNTDRAQGYSCTAIWTTNTTAPLSTARDRQNFTYTFYTANLVTGNYSALDFNGNSFFMNGTWNVWNVTESFTIITDSSGNVVSVNNNRNAVPLATNAYGELTVPSGWTSFTLAINGVNPLTGKVMAEVTTSRLFNPFMLGADSTSTTVTPADLNNIVKAYGSMPGWGNYNIRMDYNLHYQIDICDLSTAAANLNTS